MIKHQKLLSKKSGQPQRTNYPGKSDLIRVNSAKKLLKKVVRAGRAYTAAEDEDDPIHLPEVTLFTTHDKEWRKSNQSW